MKGGNRAPPPRLVRRACSVGATQAVAVLSNFLIHVLAARSLPATVYGSFALCALLGGGCQVLLLGGIPYALRRAVSVDPAAGAFALRYVLLGQIPISLTAALAVAAAAPALARLLADPELTAALVLVGAEVLFRTGLIDPCLQVLNGARADRLQALLAIGYHVARLVLAAVCLDAFGGLTGGVLGLAIAAALGAALSLPILWLLPSRGPVSAAGPALDLAAWMKTGYAHELCMFLAGAVNLWLVQFLVREREFVGVYAACTMLSRSALTLATVLIGAAFAPLARAFHDGDREGARAIVGHGCRTAVVVLLPAAAVILCYGGPLLAILCGPAYRGAGGAFVVLFSGFGLLGVCSCLTEVLGAAGRRHFRLAVAAGLAGGVGGGSAVLLGLFGPGTVAWAVPLAGGIGVVALGSGVCRLVGTFVPWATCSRAAVATLPLLAALSWLGEPGGLLPFVGSALAGAVLYFSALGLLGEFRGTSEPVPGAGPFAPLAPAGGEESGVRELSVLRTEAPLAGGPSRP